MIGDSDKRPYADVLRVYQAAVRAKHGDAVLTWPLLRGWKLVEGSFRGWTVALLQDDPFAMVARCTGVGEIDERIVGLAVFEADNVVQGRRALERHFAPGGRDALLLIPPDGGIDTELAYMMDRHERAQSLTPMKVFLSHKGADKPKVRDFKRTLDVLGFSPWLDEDSMRAGIELERGILKGFSDSCAAVFFITPNFRDESFLATEVNYALAEKRRKGDRFAIITIVFEATASRANVPDLLRQYVWKEPVDDLEALREIVAALPIRVGDVQWR